MKHVQTIIEFVFDGKENVYNCVIAYFVENIVSLKLAYVAIFFNFTCKEVQIN